MNHLKGLLRACQGEVFDANIRGTELETFLTYPVAWDSMTADQRGWFAAENNNIQNKILKMLFFPEKLEN